MDKIKVYVPIPGENADGEHGLQVWNYNKEHAEAVCVVKEVEVTMPTGQASWVEQFLSFMDEMRKETGASPALITEAIFQLKTTDKKCLIGFISVHGRKF